MFRLQNHQRILWLVATCFFCCAMLPTQSRADLSEDGPFAVGSSTVTVTRPGGSTFTALLYYPAQTAGENAALDTSSGPYSAITFGHGFLQATSRYFRTLSHLASYGHIVIASNSETGLFPNHSNFANDMRLTLDYLESRNSNSDDEFFGMVDTENLGLFGHSMGGGAGLLATAADERIKAYVGLATAITNPSPQPLMPGIRATVALMSGDEDGIVDYTTNTVPLYNAGEAPKLLPLIEGGFHVGFQDVPYPIFPDSGSISREEQLAITRSYLTSFFGLYLQDDQSLWRNIWGPEASSTDGLPTQADPGIELLVDATTLIGQPSSEVIFSVDLVNSGAEENQFSIFFEDNQWNVSVSALQTPLLQPGQSHSVMVQVEIPATAADGQTDSILLSARSQADGMTRAFIPLSVTADAPAMPLLVNSQLYHAGFSGVDSDIWSGIDSQKVVLEMGIEPQVVQLENLSASAAGINGLAMDFVNLNNLEEIDWEFSVSPTGAFDESANPMVNWAAAANPSSITFHTGEGSDGSQRVLVTWPDGAIANRYLLARLRRQDNVIAELLVGHLRGELTGPSGGFFTVSFTDISQIRQMIGATVDAGSAEDIDKNGVVAFADISAMRSNVGIQLPQITASTSQ